MKKILSLFIVSLICFSCITFCFAENDVETKYSETEVGSDETAEITDTNVNIDEPEKTITEHPPRLVDNAKILSSLECDMLSEKLDEISQRQQFDIVIVTADTLSGKSPMNFADDFYDYNGYGFGESKDGCILLLDMNKRDYWISTTGFGINALTDYGIKYISSQFVPYLSDGEYLQAFNMFADLCDEFVTQAKTSNPYDTGNIPKKQKNWFKIIAIALIIGIIGGFIAVSIMKSKLKSVYFQSNASNYVADGSISVNISRDTFLYDTVSRTRRESNSSGSSTHTSSSGTSHGGGGGKF